MVFLIHQNNKIYSKLENHHHRDHRHETEAYSASLSGFRSDISVCLSDLSSNPNPGSEFLSFPWIKQCFELIHVFHKGFAKLIVDIDYPLHRWEACLADEFFNYTLKLLDFFNSISSSLSHMGQARLRLSHALSLVETSPLMAIDRLKAIESSSFIKDLIKEGETGENCEEVVISGKESVVHHALMIMQKIGFWICGVVILGLCGDSKLYMETRKSTGVLGISSFDRLDSVVHQAVCDSEVVLKEVKEVNDVVDRLVASMAEGKSGDAAEDLRKTLEVLEKEIDDLRKEVDSFFSDVLEERNKLLDCLRQRKQ